MSLKYNNGHDINFDFIPKENMLALFHAKQNQQRDQRRIYTGNAQQLANLAVIKFDIFMISYKSCLAQYQDHIR